MNKKYKVLLTKRIKKIISHKFQKKTMIQNHQLKRLLQILINKSRNAPDIRTPHLLNLL